MMNIKKAILFLGLTIGIHSTITSAASSAEEKYLGGYTQETHETQSRIVLLEDNTFCFKFMGGSLDLLAAGKWRLNNHGISLEEIRPLSDAFPNFSDKRLNEDGLIKFTFDGYSMSNAARAIFVTSESDAQPKTFRPLFSEDQDSWKSEYVLPPIKLGSIKYFFIGYAELDQYQKPTRMKIFQYKLGDIQSLRIGFNSQAINPLINMSAVLDGNVLKVDGNTFGKRDVLTKEIFDEVKTSCIYPILHPEKSIQGENTPATDFHENTLKPIKEFYVNLNAVSGASYTFAKEDINSFKYDDWSYLDVEYKNAIKNKSDLANYLSVSAGLVKNNTDIKSHVATLISYTNALFNKYTQGADKEAGFNIADHFIDKVYPFIKEYRTDDEINKATEILISNSLGTAVSFKNEPLYKKINEKLLGPDFDIHKVKHGTLLYNLACDYARRKEKNLMLEAIKLALMKGKKPEEFKNDSDFNAYYNDPDFLKVLQTTSSQP